MDYENQTADAAAVNTENVTASETTTAETVTKSKAAADSTESAPDKPWNITGGVTEETDSAAVNKLTDDTYLDPVVIKKFDALPYYGRSYMFVPICIVLTIAGIILGHISALSGGLMTDGTMRYVYIGCGCVVMAVGFMLYYVATFGDHIKDRVKTGALVTTGAYMWCRNPQYSGILLLCTGALLISGNAFMFVLPIAYWVFLTILLKKTEEVELGDKFFEAYLDYCKTVPNRILPFKRKVK